MRLLPVILAVLSLSTLAATRQPDGSLVLAPDEVDATIQYIREMQAVAIIQQQRADELEAELKLLKQAKCL